MINTAVVTVAAAAVVVVVVVVVVVMVAVVAAKAVIPAVTFVLVYTDHDIDLNGTSSDHMIILTTLLKMYSCLSKALSNSTFYNNLEGQTKN